MVRIVIGKIDSGKTSKLFEIFQQEQRGDGIISKKYLIGSDIYGFNAFCLKNAQEFPYLIHDSQLNESLESEYETKALIGPYHLHLLADKRIREFYGRLIKSNINPLYFDEVGKLELSGKGFYIYLKNALEKGFDIYISVREDLLQDVIDTFKITDYEIIKR